MPAVLQIRRCQRRPLLDKWPLLPVSRVTPGQRLRHSRITATCCLTRNSRSPTCSGLNPDPSSNSNPDCATSAQHLHSLQPTLHAASGPATLWRTPGTRCERGHRAARQSRSHQLATVPQTIADRSFLEQIAAHLESNLLSSGGLAVFERASCLHLAPDAQYRTAADTTLSSDLSKCPCRPAIGFGFAFPGGGQFEGGLTACPHPRPA